jgi:hypothetical protein
MNLQEDISRIKLMMGLLTENDSLKVTASSDGIINIWKLQKEGNNPGTVYRYKLIANYIHPITRKENTTTINVKKIDIKTGEITFINPQDNKEVTETIEQPTIQNILTNYDKGQDIPNLMTIKSSGVKVDIGLDFYEQKKITTI